MGQTANLGLHLTATDETEKTFLQYRTELSGTGSDSNMNIIDKAYGEMDAKRASGDQLLQSQIDQIVAPSGTIDGASAAEVENARVGVDSTTYASLGEAIRGQVGDLKNASNRKMYGVFTLSELTPTQSENGKAWNGTSLVDISGYTAYKYSVIPGDSMKIVGCQPSNTYRLYRFYDGNGTQLASSLNVVPIGSGRKEADNVIVPVDAVYCWVNTYQQTVPSAYVNEYDTNPVNLMETVEQECKSYSDDKVTEAAESIVSSKLNAIEIGTPNEPSETHIGYLWTAGTLVENSLYTTYKYNVTAGNLIKVVGVQPSSENLLYRIYDANNAQIATSLSTVNTGSGKKEYAFIVPANASYIWINTANAYSDSGVYSVEYDTNPYHLPTQLIHVTVGNTGATFDTNGFEFIIRKVGANSLVNIYAGYYNGDILFATQTDWIGPYQFTKNSDAHGDLESATTGGNHSITDGVNTATTARTTSFEVLGDGSVLTPGEHWVRNTSIRWTNEVMAGNTCKYDGTGEYCLEEHCNIEVSKEGTLNVEHWFKPYYDCTLQWYSGMQFAGQGFAPGIYIPEYNNHIMTTGEINSYANLNKVNRYKAIGTVVSLEMYLDRDYGLGRNTQKSQVTGNASKAYFVLQSAYDEPLPLSANAIYAWRGSYRFFKSY